MWSQIRANRTKSIFYSLLMGAFLVATGLAFGIVMLQAIEGAVLGAIAAFLVWLVLVVTSIVSGDKILMASSGAVKISHTDFPQLFNVVEEMKIASGLQTMPEVYLIEDSIPNAFATGRGPNRCAVAVTSGLVSRLDRDELQGVIAHEISHIVNRDVMLMSVLGVTLGAIVLMSESFSRVRFYGGRRRSSSSSGGGQAQIIMFLIAFLFILLAPIFAQMIYFAVSRKREYLADACGAQYTRYPEGLASALEKISASPGVMKSASKVTAPMYIINPFSRIKEAVGMFSTHPPTSERIKVLRGMGGNCSLIDYQKSFLSFSSDAKGGSLFSGDDLTQKLYHGQPGAATGLVAGKMTVKAAPSQDVKKPIAGRGEVSDVLWKQADYKVIECSCGLKIKIPPQFGRDHIYCTKCGIKYMLTKG